MSKKRDFVLTIASNFSLQIITAICGFILPPLILSYYGSVINGMVSSIAQFIAHLNIVEAGIGEASIQALYEPISKNDVQKRNSILSATAKFYKKSGYLFSFLILILSFVYPFVIKDDLIFYEPFFMVLILGISGAAEFFLIGKYRVFLVASKKNYIITNIQCFSTICNTIFSIIFMKLGFSILLVKLFSSLIYLSRFFIILICVAKNTSDISFKEVPDINSIKQSKNILIIQISNLVIFNSPIIILTFLCSLKDVSVYTIYLMFFSSIANFVGCFSNGLQGFFGELYISKNLKKLQSFFSQYETFYYFATGCFFSLTLMLIMPLMKIYTSNFSDANYMQPRLAFLFSAVYFLNYIRNPCNTLIYAAGHFQKVQSRYILEASINLITSIVFTIKFGIIGVLLGGLCSHSYRTVDMIIYTSKYILKNNCLSSFFKILITLILYCPFVVINSKLKINIANYFQWLLYATVLGISVLILPILYLRRTKNPLLYLRNDKEIIR